MFLFSREVKLKNNIQLVVHFSYHRSMTSFFSRVFSEVAYLFNWYHKHHNSRIDDFYKDVDGIKRTSIISVNNRSIDFEKLPSYVGSHLIRDPRDLLVSGYKYHLWCKEKWVRRPMSLNFKDKLRLEELGLADKAKGKTYQKLLNSLDEVEGYKLEMNWRGRSFKQMSQWNYSNSNILEIKYEEIFGNEVKIFEKLFKHYGFPEEKIDKSLDIVRRNSFASLKKKGRTGKSKHAAVGSPSQWKTSLPKEIREAFKNEYGDLLMSLGYEKNLSW